MLFLMIESSAMWVYKRSMFWSRLPSSLKNHATCSAARIAINARQAERLRALGLCSQCRSSICRVRSVSYSLLLVKIQPQNKIITLLRSSEFLDYDLEAVNSQGSKLWRGCLFCVPGSFKIVKYQWYHKMDGVPFDWPWHMSFEQPTDLELRSSLQPQRQCGNCSGQSTSPWTNSARGKRCKERVGGWWRFVAFENPLEVFCVHQKCWLWWC